MFFVELIPDRTSFRWAVRWDSGCVPVTGAWIAADLRVCVCVCLCLGPMGVRCAGWCSIFGEVESQGLVAESFSTQLIFCTRSFCSDWDLLRFGPGVQSGIKNALSCSKHGFVLILKRWRYKVYKGIMSSYCKLHFRPGYSKNVYYLTRTRDQNTDPVSMMDGHVYRITNLFAKTYNCII